MATQLKIAIKKDSKTPVYRQISLGVVELIKKGSLNVGDQLPTERELAEQLDVARGTVSKAYETLVRESVIEVIQGSGSFVSKKQDVIEGERKGVAIRVLEGAIDELSRLRFTSQEISTFFHLLLSRREDIDCEVKILAVDCNTESLSLFEKQFFYIKNLKITKMLVSDFLKDDSLDEKLDVYDLILTTTTHHREIVLKAPKFKDKFLQCSLTLAQQTILDLVQIPVDAKIGILCETRRFFDIVQRHLVEMQISPTNIAYLSENSDLDRIRLFLARKQVVICKPQSFSGQSTPMSSVGEFLSRGGNLIYFNYQIDRGTLHQIEDKINEIIKNRSALFNY